MSSPTSSTDSSTSTTSTDSSTSTTTTTSSASSTTTTTTTSTTSSPSSPTGPTGPPGQTSSTSSTTTTTTSSTTTSSSTTSTTTTTTSSTTTSSSPSSTSTSTTFVASSPQTLTSTSIVTVPPTTTNNATALPATSAQSTGFFHNTAAVAATFSVVGLAGLALLIFGITQTIRRRRAKQFDREIAEAAAEAATAPVPVFLDDEDDNYGPGYGGQPAGGYSSPSAGYSDISSHGTYAQPPMSHEGYTPQMSERAYFDNGMYQVPPAAAGAAGIGVVRARSVRDGGGYAAALSEGNAPYPAFASSHPQYDRYSPPRAMSPPQQAMYRGPGAGPDVQSQYTAHSSGSDLSRMKSNGSKPSESYASHYQPGFNETGYQPSNYHPHNIAQDDAYGGYVVSAAADHRSSPSPPAAARGPSPIVALPNPFLGEVKSDESGDESDGEDNRRILKVANT